LGTILKSQINHHLENIKSKNIYTNHHPYYTGRNNLANFVLVHGAWHGGWCWNEVVRLLRDERHDVQAPDLPGHGNDKTSITKVTLENCVNKVCKIIRTKPEPVILVGHSMGGVVISQAAENEPDRIKTLVYLAAFLVRNGESIKTVLDNIHSSKIAWNKQCVEIQKNGIKERFYDDCPSKYVVLAKSLLCPESTTVLKTSLKLSEGNFGRIPRVYIECLKDKAVSPSLQKMMYKSLPCQKIISMETSHSPFFSRPKILVNHLIKIADSTRTLANTNEGYARKGKFLVG
jgi:pimeloyl-ACP methyl ester carboxylesterase